MRIDLKKDLPELYKPGQRDFERVHVPAANYLAVDGHGDPNTSPAYVAALEALYPAGYAVRAAFKARTGDDFVVGPLEGLWTADDPTAFASGTKDDWDWSMLIPLPAQVASADVEAGLASAKAKRPEIAEAGLYVRELHEGECLQILHVGSYDDEAPTLARLHHELMPSLGLGFNGAHHEIYLSDPRRTAPEKLRTILRQPVTPIAS